MLVRSAPQNLISKAGRHGPLYHTGPSPRRSRFVSRSNVFGNVVWVLLPLCSRVSLLIMVSVAHSHAPRLYFGCMITRWSCLLSISRATIIVESRMRLQPQRMCLRRQLAKKCLKTFQCSVVAKKRNDTECGISYVPIRNCNERVLRRNHATGH